MAPRVWMIGVSVLLAGLFSIADFRPDFALNAQPGKKTRIEEEEPEKSKVPKKIDEIEPKGAPAVPVQPLPATGKFDIARESLRAKSALIRMYLRRIAVPFDYLVPVNGLKPYKIARLAERTLPEGSFEFMELNADLESGKKHELPTAAGFTLLPYEEIVLEQVERILDPETKPKDVNHDDLVELCIQVLQATRQELASSIEKKIRTGKGWEAVDEKLRKRIVRLRRDQLKAAIEAKDWKKADQLTLELSNYSDDPEAQKDIYRLLLRKAVDALRPDHDEDFINLRDALNQFENLAGGRGEKIAEQARGTLTGRATHYLELAKKQAETNQNAAAFRLLKNAEALAPELPAIGKLRLKLHDKVLYVGVPRLPERMSPAAARGDSERWALELLFESLLQAVPDQELGRRYRPELAVGLPALAPLGRKFTLRPNARWAGDGAVVDARDVFATVELLQKSPHLQCAEGLDVIDRLRFDDPYHLRLNFRQGLLEPLSRTTFKVQPARYLKAKGKEIDDDQFARNPFGSGPYRYEGREQESSEREVAVFRANPYYGQRTGRFGLPRIQEIRFVVPKLSTAGDELKRGQLHLILDVPTADIARYRDDPQVGGGVSDYTPTINRRIYMLAINHRRLKMQNVDLRRGLAAAIDRDAIVRDIFRPDAASTYHRALTGPFPLNCWATPETARKPQTALFNKELAAGLLSNAARKDRIRLTLTYPDDDTLATRAKMKDQIEAATKKTPDDAPLVEIVLTPVAAGNLWRKLEQEQDFELAYVPYDYKDDLYWLGSLLDRTAAERAGRNYLGYLAQGTNPQPDDNDLRILLDEVRAHRDFRAKVREETWKVHAKFLARMPFIPLWQLDRHIIAHNSLEMYLDGEKLSPQRLDPATIFTGVEEWRLN